MGEAFITARGGGAGLNFKVVGGTSQPTSASENTIWVNTSTAITSWVFSAEEPASPAAGMVWFQTSGGSTAPFNAVKKNTITVYPNGCSQYVSGAWIGKKAEIYQGGAWKALWSGELYADGDTNDNVTGGWVASASCITTNQNGYTPQLKLPVITYNADNIQMKLDMDEGLACKGGSLVTANKIDVTGFSKLHFSGSKEGSSTAKIFLASTLNTSEASDANVAASADIGENQTLDISGLSGEYYIGLSFAIYYYGGSAYLNEAYLEV